MVRASATGRPAPASTPLRVLFAASEAYPLIKTGGLGDVAYALPLALHAAGVDVRVVLPAYRGVLARAGGAPVVADLSLHGGSARLRQTALPGTAVPVYLVDAPALFDRPGTPYEDAQGGEWPDNAARFGMLCRAVTAIAADRAGLAWRPDVVHCNDWHTGLVPVLLADEPARPGIVFTVHSLAYQGNFPPTTLTELGLPPSLWTPERLEFYGRLSFIKGGLLYADRITTVSPTHAREILTPAYGFGLDGVLRARRDRVSGILNGVDYTVWDPARDADIAHPFSAERPGGKRANKLALQQEAGLDVDGDLPLVAHVARLTWQKGTDILLAALPKLLGTTAMQCIVLGSGDAALQAALERAAAHWPGRVAARIGYDEPLAHRIQAGADMMALPSRFEPCGLTHLYSLRYGTVPVVRATGGMADTVVDVQPDTLRDGTATGFLFEEAEPVALAAALARALSTWETSTAAWQRIQHAGMTRYFSWADSAAAYRALYAGAVTRAGDSAA
jgi:starch synthase